MFSKAKQMLADNGAVSPVIGVILMVAVTVVLGAVIAGFVFGIGDSLGEPAPNAQIDFNYDADNDQLDILHDGGDAITGDNTGLLSITGDYDASEAGWSANFDETAGEANQGQPTERVTAGDLIYETANDEVASGNNVELQWESTGGDQSSTIGTFEAP